MYSNRDVTILSGETELKPLSNRSLSWAGEHGIQKLAFRRAYEISRGSEAARRRARTFALLRAGRVQASLQMEKNCSGVASGNPCSRSSGAC